MRIELTTSSLPRKCSTTELQRLVLCDVLFPAVSLFTSSIPVILTVGSIREGDELVEHPDVSGRSLVRLRQVAQGTSFLKINLGK